MNKEFRVYVLSADNDNELKLSGYEIENWNHYQEQHNKLTEEANKFIELCEAEGSVFSLTGFQTAFNLDETISLNDYIFITNSY